MEKLTQLVADAFQVPVETIDDESSTKTVPQWDSLGHINLVMALEQHFGVKFTIDEITQMLDLPTIRRILEAKTK